jgi:hypothetical protein
MATNSQSIPTTVRTSKTMRWFFVGATMLVAFAAIPLFFFSEKTNEYFAWTIQPPLSAAFLGAGYWAVTLAVILALRDSEWTRVRIVLPVLATGVTAILLATLLHLDRFHLNSPIFTAQMEAWAWLILYVGLIPALGLAVFKQRQEQGSELPRQAPFPTWLRGLMGLLGGLMLLIGVAMFIAPLQVAPIWGWTLTPLTGRMAASWFTAIGVSLLVGVRENEYSRVYVAASALVAYAVLQALNLVRYSATIQWGQPNIWLFVAILLALFVIGVTVLRGHQAQTRQT